MKLIIQIPCYNEERTLPETLRGLPRHLAGIDKIEYLVIDDGSRDRTADVALREGVHHVIRLGVNRGAGFAFQKGLQRCIQEGADIIVNTDGDNQYRGDDIPSLIKPILAGDADIVVGARPIEAIEEFSRLKKILQRLGSTVVRRFSGTDVPDATCGFRAYAAEAAMRLFLGSRYSHTLETLIQAGTLNMRIGHVPIRVNPKTRPSRLMSSMWQYVWRSVIILLRSYVQFKPLRTFFYLSLVPGISGLLICLRFLFYFFTREPAGHIQSLILAAILLLIAFHLMVLGVLGDLSATGRNLLQELLYLNRLQRYREAKRGHRPTSP